MQGGSADAGISIEPLTSGYLAANPTAKQVDRAAEITDRSSFLIAASATLEDEGKEAALADYTARLVRSFNFLRQHPDLVADAVFVKQYGLTPERAKEILAQQGVAKFFALPGEVKAQQQKLADLFFEAGQIPAKVDGRRRVRPPVQRPRREGAGRMTVIDRIEADRGCTRRR